MTTIYIVTTPSGVHIGRCLLGYGSTRNEALEDAFGDRPPRPNRRNPWILEEIPEHELYEKWI